MNDIEHTSITPSNSAPRHAHVEIADLLSAALLRLRARNSRSDDQNNSGHRESRFNNWPTSLREQFEAARTVKPGKAIYALDLDSEE